MTAALTRSNCAEKHFSFQPARELSECHSDAILISGGRLFHADGPPTEKLRGRTEASCSGPRHQILATPLSVDFCCTSSFTSLS